MGTFSIWTLGFPEERAAALRETLGKKFHLTNWPEGIIPSLEACEQGQPRLMLIRTAQLRLLLSMRGQPASFLRCLPKVLLLDEGYVQSDLEFGLDAGVQEIIRPPCSSTRLREKVARIIEMEEIQEDVLRMVQEISLERELLERKSRTLDFLVGFLTYPQDSADPGEILRRAFLKLQTLLPLRHPQVAVWDPDQGSRSLRFYLTAQPREKSFQAWVAALKKSVRPLCPCSDISVFHLEEESRGRFVGPEEGKLLTLPLSLHGVPCGMVLALEESALILGRDESMSINAALRHLALDLQNSLRRELGEETGGMKLMARSLP
ncbi:MAG: hypothetical protein FWF99_05680 [Desulfovibrionaceae bacterium]|nr:hypothetical protein [Desulfovibrionaceae bacterium]